jgi:hypothetical protein
MQKRAILRAIFTDSNDGLKNTEEMLKDMDNAKVVDDVKTLLHLCQYAEIENRLITRIDHWRDEIISHIINTNPDLPMEERNIILNRNTTPPADDTLSQPIDEWLQMIHKTHLKLWTMTIATIRTIL